MSDISKQKGIAGKTLKLYVDATKPYKKQLIIMVVTRVVYLIATYIGNLYLAGIALDKLASGGPFSLWQDFGWIIIGLISFSIIQMICEIISIRTIWWVSETVRNNLGRKCHEKLMQETAHFHANRFAGSLVSQTNKFVGSYERLLDTMYWQVFALFANIVFTLVILLPRIPTYTVILFGLLSLYFVVSITLNRKAQRLNTVLAHTETALTGQLADSVGNILAIKSHASEAHEQQLYRHKTQNIFKASMRLRHYAVLKDSIISIPLNAATILAVVFSVIAANNGAAPLSTILLAATLTRDLFMRSREFNVNSLRNIARSIGDAHDMTMILSTPTEITDEPEATKLDVASGDITFQSVDFRYQTDSMESLFSSLALHIPAKQKVGLVGPSGGGKTTVTKLLLRFMDIQCGQILIDNQDIATVTQKSLRESIAYVPQEPLLFHRSLAENIRYGNPQATDEQVLHAARLAHAHEFIEKLPDKYETLVGERGVKLSGGQKQRIAIARAILKDAPILVLDEATSALDSESEKLIQDALKNLMEGKTTIVIAHRLSTIQHLDRIIVLEEGSIVEEGPHKKLIEKKNGLYARLWQHQSGGFLQD